MPCVREGIENVRATVLPDGMAVDGSVAAFSRTVLVTWRSDLSDRLYQVYVNGVFAGATLHAQQRQLVIQTPSSFESAVRIEVVAVELAEAHHDFADDLDHSTSCNARVRLTLLRSQSLPVDAKADVYFDHGTGDIDYSVPLNEAPIPLWPCRQDKAGFALAQFGTGDFGYDSAAAIGFGKGLFGRGQFGLDADAMEWTSPILPLGAYRFGVKVLDLQGNESQACETAPIAIIPPARPVANLDVAAFDEQTNALTLNVSD